MLQKLCLKFSVPFHFSGHYCFSTLCKIQVILCSLLWNSIYHQILLPLDLAWLTPRLTMYMHMTELLKRSRSLSENISHCQVLLQRSASHRLHAPLQLNDFCDEQTIQKAEEAYIAMTKQESAFVQNWTFLLGYKRCSPSYLNILAESFFYCFFSGNLGCFSWTWTGANWTGMLKAGCTTCPCLPWQIPTATSAFSKWAVTLSIIWVMSELSAIMASESLIGRDSLCSRLIFLV